MRCTCVFHFLSYFGDEVLAHEAPDFFLRLHKNRDGTFPLKINL